MLYSSTHCCHYTHLSTCLLVLLRTASHTRLYNGKAAETELKALADQGRGLQSNNLVRHNIVVFSSGQGALKVYTYT
jgi:intraflagellar transport protein 56